jgi:hypothetical protein
MKLYLNIFLIAVLCFHFSTCKRTEETTQEEDGTIKTVITDEWETEKRRGNGRGRGDTIVVMTNENENDNQNENDEPEVAEPRSISIKDKTSPLIRFLYADNTDYYYSADPQEQKTLENVFFKNDANLGQVVTKREDFPECFDLVPIFLLRDLASSIHALIVTFATIYWENTGVIGYGVLEKGKCGATIAVRQLAKPGYASSFIQTASDTERSKFLALGYVDYEPIFFGPTFYIWDTAAQFQPPQYPHTSKTSLLTRLYNEKETDYHYSVAQKEQATLGQASYQFNGNMGRVVTKQSDMSACSDFVAITRLSNAQFTSHVLIVTASDVNKWKNDGGWTDAGIIGYGVLEKGRCGATVAVRQLVRGDSNHYFQTSNDVEYNIYKKRGYADGVAPVFYIWDA